MTYHDPFFADSKIRLWLRSWNDEHATYLNDPAAGSWLSYPTYKRALLGQLNLPGFALLDLRNSTPVYGSERRIALSGGNWELNFFEGHIWHQWKRSDIIPHDTQFAFEPPFFNKAGLLCVNIDHDGNKSDATQKSWSWSEAAVWHQVPCEEGPNDWIVGIRQLQPEPPDGCPKPDFLSLVKDNKGIFWLTSDHVLSSVKDGKCKPAQEAGLPTPFLDGRRVSRAMTDPLGNTFLMTESGNSREYVIVPPQP